jgi:hypothetical protein
LEIIFQTKIASSRGNYPSNNIKSKTSLIEGQLSLKQLKIKTSPIERGSPSKQYGNQNRSHLVATTLKTIRK